MILPTIILPQFVFNPDFSIVTPTFRQLDWLRLCIASVRDQVLHSALSIEHIIQDAGTPGIEELARELGAEFYRNGQLVFVERKEATDEGRETSHQHPNPAAKERPAYSLKIFSEKDAGMYDAINRGLAHSTGEICAWLNSDEQYLPETLSKVAEIFQQQTKLDILLGDAILLNSSLEPICYRKIMVPGLWHTRLDHLHSLSCAMFFKKSTLPNPPLNPHWKVISDAVLMEHFLVNRKKLHACRKLLAAYAFTGQNLSADKNCKELEQWWAETKWPPRALKPLVVMYNRIRRLLTGAYRSFPIDTKIHTSSGYKSLKGSVSGLWPS
jgi:glycosyltransferase involved in cell wall biosynthesis